jgi:hypothetical protein
VDNLAFRILKRISRRRRSAKEAVGALSGYMITILHYQISYQSHAKDRHGNAARKP